MTQRDHSYPPPDPRHLTPGEAVDTRHSTLGEAERHSAKRATRGEAATLCIFGAGGHAKVVADIALQAGWSQLRFYSDDYPAHSAIEHWPIHGGMDALLAELPNIHGVIVAIGDCTARQQKQEQLLKAGATLATLIHPRATISPFAKIGPGSVIVAGAIINAFATIGQGCIINTGSTIGHDCKIGDYVHIAPGANLGGEVKVGLRSWIGIGASVRQGVIIGSDVVAGAGAALINSIWNNTTVVGVPAKALHKKMQI